MLQNGYYEVDMNNIRIQKQSNTIILLQKELRIGFGFPVYFFNALWLFVPKSKRSLHVWRVIYPVFAMLVSSV